MWGAEPSCGRLWGQEAGQTLDLAERSGALEMQVMSALVWSAPALRCVWGGLNPSTVILGRLACAMDHVATGFSSE